MAAKKKIRKGATSGRSKAASKKALTRKTSRKKTVSRSKKKASRKGVPSRRSKAARDDHPVIVYIHGIGEHPPKDEFKSAWDLSLFGRDMGSRTRMAYWADILHGDAKSKKGKQVKRVRARKVPLEAAALLREAKLDPNNEKALQFVESLAATLAEPGRASSSRRGMRTKVLPLPGFLRRRVAEKLLRWFVKDTAAYFYDDQIRQRIKRRLVQQIPTRGEPFLLISHSQGTIVGFEVLTELRRRAEVSLFATMGPS